MSIWAALLPAAFPDGEQVQEKQRTQGAELQGSVGPVGGLANRAHGTKAILGPPSGSGDTRTAPMPYSTKLPLPG